MRSAQGLKERCGRSAARPTEGDRRRSGGYPPSGAAAAARAASSASESTRLRCAMSNGSSVSVSVSH